MPANADLFLKACVAKWGYRRVLDMRGNAGVEIQGRSKPRLMLYELRDGEQVYFVAGRAEPGAKLVGSGSRG